MRLLVALAGACGAWIEPIGETYENDAVGFGGRTRIPELGLDDIVYNIFFNIVDEPIFYLQKNYVRASRTGNGQNRDGRRE
jgi:hypothetical protein